MNTWGYVAVIAGTGVLLTLGCVLGEWLERRRVRRLGKPDRATERSVYNEWKEDTE